MILCFPMIDQVCARGGVARVTIVLPRKVSIRSARDKLLPMFVWSASRADIANPNRNAVADFSKRAGYAYRFKRSRMHAAPGINDARQVDARRVISRIREDSMSRFAFERTSNNFAVLRTR